VKGVLPSEVRRAESGAGVLLGEGQLALPDKEGVEERCKLPS